MQHEFILVLGMHKSGTSLLANLLQVCGVYLGESNELKAGDPENIFGFFEFEKIKEVNDEILTYLGGSWYEPPRLPQDWKSDVALQDFQIRLHELLEKLKNSAPASQPLALKDPRICLLLPFWEDTLGSPKYVYIFRNPAEVADSLGNKLIEIDRDRALQLWEIYNRECVNFLADKEHFLIEYESLLEEPVRQGAHLAEFLGKNPTDQLLQKINLTIVPDLRHNRHDGEATLQNEQLPQKLKTLYGSLLDTFSERNKNYTKQIDFKPDPELKTQDLERKLKSMDKALWREREHLQHLFKTVAELESENHQLTKMINRYREANNNADKVVLKLKQDLKEARKEIAKLHESTKNQKKINFEKFKS